MSLSVQSEKGDKLVANPPVTPKNDSLSKFVKILKPNEKYEIEYIGLKYFDPLTKRKI